MSFKETGFRNEIEEFIPFVELLEQKGFEAGRWPFVKRNGEEIVVETWSKDVVYKNKGIKLLVIKDLSEKIRVKQKLDELIASKRALALRLENSREVERAAMAREIHDHLGQSLILLKLNLVDILNKLKPEDEFLHGNINKALEKNNEIIKAVRDVATKLRPTLLDDLGLSAALEWQCHEFKRETGLLCYYYDESIDEKLISKDIATCLFRVCQEAFTNIIKHASASIVQIRLSIVDNEFLLSISDNGIGFDPKLIRDKKTIGLLSMQERVFLIGGHLFFETQPGAGTTIKVKIKL